MDPGYPFVECKSHGKSRSYIICPHAFAGKKPRFVRLATDQEMGTITCEKCTPDKTSEQVCIATFKVICQPGAIDRGLLMPVD